MSNGNYKTCGVSMNEGQTLDVKQISGDQSKLISMKIVSPTGEVVSDEITPCNNHSTVSPTIKGVYSIDVTVCSEAGEWIGDYLLRVSADSNVVQND